MKRTAFALAALLTVTLAGCGGGENKNVAEGADQSAIDEYERLQQEEQKAMGASMEGGMKKK